MLIIYEDTIILIVYSYFLCYFLLFQIRVQLSIWTGIWKQAFWHRFLQLIITHRPYRQTHTHTHAHKHNTNIDWWFLALTVVQNLWVLTSTLTIEDSFCVYVKYKYLYRLIGFDMELFVENLKIEYIIFDIYRGK